MGKFIIDYIYGCIRDGYPLSCREFLITRVISLDDLIANKRASGRPKDIVDAMTLEKMKEMKNG